ncbi:hypothetical protein E6O75_ATG08541 [Venturia nashicola]|uniref:Cutinase n=1 Tax=Venturia nashicola TaxID=86259 RepID=A0A4Z1P3T0_9PEZI|nr:hypothetical protein E6O75_ATG08541 [Venturia nashicola]
MKISFLTIAATAAVTLAAPAPPIGVLHRRQQTANDVIKGPCKKVTLIFARASTEPGNMGGSMGPAVCKGLKSKFSNDVACQGVGGAYKAGLADNVAPAGTTAGAIAEATKMFTEAHQKCPQTKIVAGGYSQGTAVMMNAVSKLPPELQSKVLAVTLFGYTKNGQQKGGIPNYPKEKVAVYCSKSDGVCAGKLNVTGGHFSYMGDGSGPKAIAFLTEAITKSAAGGGESAAPAAAAEEPSAEAPAEAASPKPAPAKSAAPKGFRPKASKGDA